MRQKMAEKGMGAEAPDARKRTEREADTGKYVLNETGTRTIYLYTVDWSVCGHNEGKFEGVVRG